MMHSVDRKHSKKRDTILLVIRSTETHPTARWVYEKAAPLIPGLSLGTVYRNINLFREEGLVVSVGVVDGEERFDGRVEPHPHAICEHCGAVFDLAWEHTKPDMGEVSDTVITPRTGDRPANFRIDYRKTVFYGVCSQCG
jgi:Fur family peroxide stress response transcriptional regulator